MHILCELISSVVSIIVLKTDRLTIIMSLIGSSYLDFILFFGFIALLAITSHSKNSVYKQWSNDSRYLFEPRYLGEG